ncbi:MAG: PDZ domain-containing protein, partial [Phycisphaerae bacterium]
MSKLAVLFVAVAPPGSPGSNSGRVFTKIDGRELFMRTIEMYTPRDQVVQRILCVSVDDLQTIQSKYSAHLGFQGVSVAAGGPDWFGVVARGLEKLKPEIDTVMIHDAACPVVPFTVLDALEAAAAKMDAGAAAVAGADGAFLVSGLPARTVTLHVAADGHHARIVTGIDVPDGGAAGPVDVKLTPLAEGEEPRVELAGIGVAMQRQGRNGLRITFVVPGGGAAEAGLAVDDVILSVEGRPVSEIGMDGAVELIRGPEDTRVRLVVRRGELPPA